MKCLVGDFETTLSTNSPGKEKKKSMYLTVRKIRSLLQYGIVSAHEVKLTLKQYSYDN